MLYDQLKQYCKSDVYPFHMPGHKRCDIIGDGCLPYTLDLTEIPGFDNLHAPSGCIKRAEELAAELYGVKHAIISVNGATGGILSSVKAMTKRGDRILMARNCHQSVYHAVQLLGLVPEYIFPDSITDGYKLSIYGGVDVQSIEKQLIINPDIKLVIVTSPTYEGVCSDIKEIAQTCHKYGVMLFVDEAHGAHFPFHRCFPPSAISCGADAAVVSLHKTLPALTQTALLLTNNPVLAQKLRGNMSVFESSSPSYILMASVERCLNYVKTNPDEFDLYIKRLELFYKRTKSLKHLFVFDPDSSIVAVRDIGKIIIFTTHTDLTGHELAEKLRSSHHLETEMASVDYVIAVTSVCDTDDGFDRLLHALSEIDKACKTKIAPTFSIPYQAPQKALLPFEADDRKGCLCSFLKASDKVSLEFITAYPPGIPLIVPGEVINDEMIEYISHLQRNGVEIISSAKNMPDSVLVAEM